MPSKQKRRRTDDDESNRDLPPTKMARPLPTITKKQVAAAGTSGKSGQPGRKQSAAANNAGQPSQSTKKRKKPSKNPQDDTPKAFARIMAFQRTGRRPNGLDDGNAPPSKKKRKQKPVTHDDEENEASASQTRKPTQNTQPAKPDARPQKLRILPGERLADFSARVNQALPVSGLTHKGKKIEGMAERKTKLQKRITRRQDQWRKQDELRKEKEAEARDEAEDPEEVDHWQPVNEGKGRSKRARRMGELAVEEDDPWKKLEQMREKRKGLWDVVQAPPRFAKLPTEKLKAKKHMEEDVPALAGSGKKRQDLAQHRANIIDSYRKMMQSKRGPADVEP